MKKIIALIITSIMVISCLSTVCFAATINKNVIPLNEELMINPGFENGNTNGWSVTGDKIQLVTDKANVHSGSYAAKWTKTSANHWTNTAQSLVSTENKVGRYEASCWVKNAGSESFAITLSVKRNKTTEAEASYSSSVKTTLVAGGEYTKLSVSFWMNPSEFTSIGFYWTGIDDVQRSFYVDDCSFKKVLNADESSMDDFSNYIRTSKTSVGAIRWDAYYRTTNSAAIVSNQVARTLSNYQDQAPFYIKKNDGFNSQYVDLKFESANEQYDYVSMKNSNMETLSTSKLNYTYGVSWNTEAKYAMDAGLDYFAYLKYVSVDSDKSPSEMSLPMLAHIAKDGYLDDGRQMKMCCIFSESQKGRAIAVDINKYATDLEKAKALDIDCKEIYLAMASSCYLTIPTKDGSRVAVMYFYQSMNATREQIEIVKDQARFFTSYLASIDPEKYTPVDDIYFIGMDGGVKSPTSAIGYNYNGFSALSRYSVGVAANEECDGYQTESMDVYEYNNFTSPAATDVTVRSVSFAELAKQSMAYNEGYSAVKDYIQCVPLSTAGRSQVPRIKVSTSWTDNDIPGSSGGHYGFEYTRKGTPQEIADHLRENIEWVQDNPDCTLLNSVLIYAWNEHDEGGWLCPTAVCDGNGKIIFDENGNATADTSILDAVKTVLDEYDSKATVTVTSQNAPDGAKATVTYEKSGATETQTVSFPDELNVENIKTGQTVTLSATGANFAGWYKTDNGKNTFISNDATVQTVNNNQNETYVAVYREDGDITVTFKDLQGNAVRTVNARDIDKNNIPVMENNLDGISFAGWMVSGQLMNEEQLISAARNAKDNVVACAKFFVSANVTLTVSGEVEKDSSGQYEKLTVVTVKAKEENSSGEAFSYWKYTDSDGDHILSSNRIYSFYITNDTDIVAVYGSENDAKAEINITSVKEEDSKIVVTVQRSVRPEYTVVEQGILLTKDNGVGFNDIILGSPLINDKVIICARSEGKANNGLLVVTKLNVQENDNWRFKAYVVYKDAAGNIYTSYSKNK